MSDKKKRLIDANKLIDYVMRCNYEGGTSVRNQAGNDVLHFHLPNVINAQPTVDAVEVVHGRWLRVYDDSAGWVDMCNKCKEFGEGTHYCPNCGAKMDYKGT